MESNISCKSSFQESYKEKKKAKYLSFMTTKTSKHKQSVNIIIIKKCITYINRKHSKRK